MRIYLRLLVVSLLLFVGNIVYAEAQQEKRVTGTVTSEGEPLPGVSVQLKGASSGTITDIDGKYSIEVPATGTLVFRFVGMRTVEQPVNNRSVINVTLESESKELEEVMVVAYATAKKYSFTGAASTMKAGEIEKLQTSSISRVLEGTVSGVQASAASGQPGTDAEIRIRGIGSINASSAPLYVVDGVPFDGSVNSINPDDISSMTVLKDAASAALYGSRGANGVIIITTKQGDQNTKATVKVKASLGGSNRAVRDYDRVSTDQYFELYWEALRNQYAKSADYTPATAATQASKDLVTKLMGGGPNPYGPQYAQPVGTDGKLVAGARPLWNSDWSDAMEQQALRTELNLSVSGGGKANQYFFSAGYLNDKGIALESGYQRFNLRSNITSEMTSWLKGGVNLSFAHSMQNYPVSSDSKTSNVITAGRTMPGFYPIYEMNTDGSYKLDESGDRIYDFGSYRPSGSMANWNLPATLPLDKSERMKDEVSGRTFLEATIIEGLKFKTSFNFDLINYNTLDYTNPKLGPAKENGGGVSRMNTRTFSWTWNNIVTYDKTIGEHHFNVLAGVEAYSYRYDELTASRSKMAQPDMPELVVGSQLTGGSGYRIDYALVGYLTQALYDYQNKYFFSASYRRDGSSRFAPETRWGNFWSVSGMWHLGNENFMKAVKPVLSDVKIRASYGVNGNQPGSYYGYKGLYSYGENYMEAAGSYESAQPNDLLTWEKNYSLNLGIDLSFINRIFASLEYYNRDTKDLLYSLPISATTGFTSYLSNIGRLNNKGVEFELRTLNVVSNDFNWTSVFNLSHNRNKIVSLNGLLDQTIEGTWFIHKVGLPYHTFYVKEFAGVDPLTGSAQYYLNTKNEDGSYNRELTTDAAKAESIPYKTATPKVSGGFTNILNYKWIDLTFTLTYSLGGYSFDKLGTYIENGSSSIYSSRYNLPAYMMNRWQKPGDQTDIPRFVYGEPATSTNSSRYIHSTDHLRLKNFTLGFTLPNQWTQKLMIDKVRIYFSGNNLLTWAKWKQYDPETPVNGEVFCEAPAMRTFSFGAQLSF